MHIWVDADACPVVIQDILFRMAKRVKLPLTLVANRLLRVPPSPYIRALQVPMGLDVADRHMWKKARSCSTCVASAIAPKIYANGWLCVI